MLDRSRRALRCSPELSRMAALAVQRLLEAAHAAAQRATHLGKALGAEHEQRNDQQEEQVNWILKTHHLSGSNRVGLVSEACRAPLVRHDRETAMWVAIEVQPARASTH